MEHDNLFIQILEILSIKYTKDFTLRFYEKHPHKTACLDYPRCYVIIR